MLLGARQLRQLPQSKRGRRAVQIGVPRAEYEQRDDAKRAKVNEPVQVQRAKVNSEQ